MSRIALIRQDIEALQKALRSLSANIETAEADASFSVPIGTALSHASPTNWRDALRTLPPDTRLGAAEVAKALGQREGWVHDNIADCAGRYRLPHRRCAGRLVFVVGELREWVRLNEEVVHRMRPGDIP